MELNSYIRCLLLVYNFTLISTEHDWGKIREGTSTASMHNSEGQGVWTIISVTVAETSYLSNDGPQLLDALAVGTIHLHP